MGKFENYLTTAKGENRAYVDMPKLNTLWLNTGTLCNITCGNCYIESSPKNDALVYMTYEEVVTFLDEIKDEDMGTTEIGITGGEPFMNPDIMPIIKECLSRGFKLVVLTNAMRALEGLIWLSDNNFDINIAGRTRWGEKEEDLREGYKKLFAENNIKIDAFNMVELVLFPEMDEVNDVPEITTDCWGILDIKPEEIMCADSRMVVKRKGAEKPAVLACTLLPYEDEFEFASTLKESSDRVYLNHQSCAKFCVLGGGSCSVKAE